MRENIEKYFFIEIFFIVVGSFDKRWNYVVVRCVGITTDGSRCRVVW